MIVHDKVSHIKIDKEDGGMRLDNYLIRVCKSVPKSHIYRIIRSGEVRVNSGRVKVFHRLQAGDILRLPPLRRRSEQGISEQQQEIFIDLLHKAVLYESAQYIIVNKPAGMACHAGTRDSVGLIEGLRASCAKAERWTLAHRLDKSTSGTLLFAKHRSNMQQIQQLFNEQKTHKFYLALVYNPKRTKPPKYINSPLKEVREENAFTSVVVCHTDGKHTLTHTRVLQHYPKARASLVLVKLGTGRMHQIRVHLSSCGYPILGDKRYGNHKVNRSFAKQFNGGLCLHACSLKFIDNMQERVFARAPICGKFKSIMQQLQANDNTI